MAGILWEADIRASVQGGGKMNGLLPLVHDHSAPQSGRWRDQLDRHPQLRDQDRSRLLTRESPTLRSCQFARL